jgi:acyl-coenzyme A synthetase/AMP-(fatty) acid ligase
MWWNDEAASKWLRTGKHNIIVIDEAGSVKELVTPSGSAAETSTVIDPDIIYALSTSGTTGAPKIVRVSHDCVYSNVRQLNEQLGARKGDRWLLSSPISFDPSMIGRCFSSLLRFSNVPI